MGTIGKPTTAIGDNPATFADTEEGHTLERDGIRYVVYEKSLNRISVRPSSVEFFAPMTHIAREFDLSNYWHILPESPSEKEAELERKNAETAILLAKNAKASE